MMPNLFKILLFITLSVFINTNISAGHISANNPTQLTKINLALKKGTTGNIDTQLGELLVKMVDGYTPLLNKITASTNWTKAKLTKLSNDLANAPPAFKNKILNNPQLIEAWEIIRRNIDNFGATTTKFALDNDVLDKVHDLIKDGSNFRNAFSNNWKTKLDDILKANTELRCLTCNNINTTNSLLKRLPTMPEMLENVEFISQYHNVTGFKKLINLIKSNANNRDGINHMIRYIKNNSTEFTTIVEFEFQYADNILNKADLFANGVKYEFKSWTPFTPNPWNSFFAGNGNSYTQFIRYLENSNSLNELKYIFNANKTNLTTVKNEFKNLFINNAEEMFKTIENGGLGIDKMKQLFEFSTFTFDNVSQFKNLFNNNAQFRNNALRFIKCE